MSTAITLTCPHCACTLKVDIEAGVIVSHEAPVAHREAVDFDARLKQIEDDKRRASDRMAEAMRREKDRERIMEDRFRQLMDKAKESGEPSKPIRDIDLD